MENHGFIVLWMVLIGGTLLWREAVGLVAYDCADREVNISAISLRNVAKCPEPDATYHSKEIQVKVVQRAELGLQHVWTCLVEVMRLITYCGMHSHSSVVAGGLSSYIHRLGAEECRMVHRYKVLKLGQQTIGQLVLNGTTSTSITLQGYVDSTGYCEGTSYQENGISWHNVVITATVKIALMDYFAMVKLADNEISLKGGVTCPFLDNYCFDSTIGESTWDFKTDNTCEDKLRLLYNGVADKVTNSRTGEQYIVVDKDPKIFAVTLVKKVQLCGLELWQTEHPKLLILEGEGPGFQPTTVLIPGDTDLMLYVNSKFLYVEQSYKRGLEALAVDTIHRRCLVQREILKNRLLLAPVVPDAVSQIIQDKEGYIGHVLGEVLYILRCVPKQVEIRRTDRCYQELPVLFNNQSKFMSPITRVLQDHGEEIDCNSLTPPLYYIEGEWIGFVPNPTLKYPPKELDVMKFPRVRFQPIQPLGAQGLYTQEEISKVQRLLTFGTERKVVENIITRRVAGMEAGGQGFSTLGIFNPQEMKELAHTTMKQIWGWFTDLGIFMSGLIGFYVIFRTVKYVVGVVINGLHLYQTVGGGFALLASLWNTLTVWVIHRHQRNNVQAPVTEVVSDQPEEVVEVQSGSSPQPPVQPPRLYPVFPYLEEPKHP